MDDGKQFDMYLAPAPRNSTENETAAEDTKKVEVLLKLYFVNIFCNKHIFKKKKNKVISTIVIRQLDDPT